jgi:hypothetical protein
MNLNNNQYESCPVCHNALTGIEPFCPVCSYELHRLPSGFILEEETKRQELASKIYEKYLQFEKIEKDNKLLQDKIEELVRRDNETIASKIPERPVKRIGYLVMQDGPGTTPYDIFPVNEGLNIYGNDPTPSQGSFCHNIANLNPELQSDHFCIDTKTEKGIEAKILNGSWSVDSRNNHPDSFILTNGSTLFIGNFILTFVEHYE